MTLDKRLDAACRALEAREPWFAPNFEAARALLNSATFGAGVVKFPHGIVCGPDGCNCGNRACLHAGAWRMYAEEVGKL